MEKRRKRKNGRFLNSLIDFIEDFDCNIQAICIYTRNDSDLPHYPPKPAAKISLLVGKNSAFISKSDLYF